MKTKKIIFGLSFFAIVAICSLNVQSTFSMSQELGYSSLTDLITLNSASADVGGGGCTGSTCDDANGFHYGTHGIGTTLICCGIVASSSGKKKS